MDITMCAHAIRILEPTAHALVAHAAGLFRTSSALVPLFASRESIAVHTLCRCLNVYLVFVLTYFASSIIIWQTAAVWGRLEEVAILLKIRVTSALSEDVVKLVVLVLCR